MVGSLLTVLVNNKKKKKVGSLHPIFVLKTINSILFFTNGNDSPHPLLVHYWRRMVSAVFLLPPVPPDDNVVLNVARVIKYISFKFIFFLSDFHFFPLSQKYIISDDNFIPISVVDDFSDSV